MAALVKRKGAGAGGGGVADDADTRRLIAPATDRVHALEYDIRPLCANDPAVRYVRRGEQLVRAATTASTGKITDDAHAFEGGEATGRDAVKRWRLTCWVLPMVTLVRELKEMFLPAGYPDSVSEDYLRFQCWDTVQAMCSYLRGVLATQSVLQSVGVGDDSATPLAAALQWVIRDGAGMLGGLAFAYWVGPTFDFHVKRWRLFADVINDVGLTLDMMAPYATGSLVTHVLCVSSICKTMCGVAAGATRSSLMTHFAQRDNMADCAAKEGSQETAVKLGGLVFGMYFASVVNTSKHSVWVAFIGLTVIHVIANYNAVSGLCIPTLNRQRAWIAIDRFLDGSTALNAGSSAEGVLPPLSIRSVNQREPILRDPLVPVNRIIMGAQLFHVVATPRDLDDLTQLYSNELYLLTVQDGCVFVVLQAEAQARDELRAYFQAVVILRTLAQEPVMDDRVNRLPLERLQATHQRMATDFAFFLSELQRHRWKTHHFLLNSSQWRIKLAAQTD